MKRAAGKSKLEKHVAFTGTFLPVVLFGVALISLAASIWTRHHTLTALATWFTLQSLLYFETRFQPTHPDTALTGSRVELPRLYGSAIALWLLLTATFGLGYRPPAQVPSAMQTTVALTVVATLFGFAGFLFRYLKLISSDTLIPHVSLLAWSRASLWMVGSGFLLIGVTALGGVETQRPLVQTMIFLSLIPVMEWLIRTLISETGSVSLVNDTRIMRVLFSRLNPAQSSFDYLDQKFGVDIRTTWALTFVRRVTARLTVALAGLAWLSTSLVTIDTVEVGLYERFGAPASGAPLGPGLHLKAPWPIDRVHRIETSRIRTIPLGFYGPQTGVSLLWTKQHAAEEHNLLLGDGRDLITVNAILEYKIQNPTDWHYQTQNPEAVLRVVAEQALLKNTVNRSLDDVLSENTETLAHQIERDVRQGVREYQIGAEIIGVTLQGLHPPIRVAEDYQAVISAQHEGEISILAGRKYETESLGSARRAALELVADAQAKANAMTAQARGDAGAFLNVQVAYSSAPSAFEHRLRLQALSDALEGRALNIIDDRIEQDGGVLWFQE